ncbi:MAG: dTDP-glucose 4,6-dehydratase [Nitrospirales bacterium]|nr:dTDP-glucose 4,6-dehydratase [Nitrospirales bacterium]
MSRHTMVITGGAGFIGANFVRMVLKKPDAHVIIIDKLTYAGHRENLDGLWEHPRLEFIHGDIADAETMGRVMDTYQPRWVINFAAESHVDRSIDNPFPFIHTNVTGTLVLLEAARQMVKRNEAAHRSNFRFLHVSTDEVYGTLGATGFFHEETPYAPNSPYAASKAGADHFVRAYFHTYGLPTLMTNCSNNYGPYQFPEKLIPLTVLNALDGKPLPIYGRGTNVRDWLFVDDHCEGLFLVLEKGQPGERYNLGGQSERTNVTVVDHICDILDEIAPCHDNPMVAPLGISKYAELKTFVKDRPGHDFRYAIDPSKIQRELGWNPRHSFPSGIRHTVQWYVTNRRWCELVTQNVYHRERLGLETPRLSS